MCCFTHGKKIYTNLNSHSNTFLKFVDFCLFWSWLENWFGSEKCPNMMKASKKSWFTVYQEGFLISHLNTFWGQGEEEEEGDAEWES